VRPRATVRAAVPRCAVLEHASHVRCSDIRTLVEKAGQPRIYHAHSVCANQPFRGGLSRRNIHAAKKHHLDRVYREGEGWFGGRLAAEGGRQRSWQPKPVARRKGLAAEARLDLLISLDCETENRSRNWQVRIGDPCWKTHRTICLRETGFRPLYLSSINEPRAG